ncbi:hypothetical protein [Haloarcula amylovorans]|uniref:hypothetical protein n=1 Tax=Haloarcula amylovorans TaxID=2562280 RepID=UPI0014309501|nr:hypothetical protein [Halomicroarcula amylolytica]
MVDLDRSQLPGLALVVLGIAVVGLGLVVVPYPGMTENHHSVEPSSAGDGKLNGPPIAG